MLLPTVPGAKRIAEALTTSPQIFDGAVTGLLVTDPAIKFERTIKSMKAANNRWVANLPTIGLHDAEFKSFLNEVALGVPAEIDILAKFKAHGIKIMAVLADFSEAKAMAKLNPDAVLIMPKVSDYLDGWPSLATRVENERTIRAALSQNGWDGRCRIGRRVNNGWPWLSRAPPGEDNNGWPCVERPGKAARAVAAP